MNIITPTADGSNTLFNEEVGEHYHSKHGAVQESRHVFIQAGLAFAAQEKSEISILEVGFGTGLNFLLTSEYCETHKINLGYTSLEAYPLKKQMVEQTGYDQYVPDGVWESFISNYEAAMVDKQMIGNLVNLEVLTIKLENYHSDEKYDLIYFDAFSVQHQPELWSDEVIEHVCSFLKPKGVFVTYAITGKLKRALKSCGLSIEKLPGAPGKREMLRALKW